MIPWGTALQQKGQFSYSSPRLLDGFFNRQASCALQGLFIPVMV